MIAAIVCDDKELETYDVKQEGTSSLTAFIASEAGKVRSPWADLLRTAEESFHGSAIQNHVFEQIDQRRLRRLPARRRTTGSAWAFESRVERRIHRAV